MLKLQPLAKSGSRVRRRKMLIRKNHIFYLNNLSKRTQVLIYKYQVKFEETLIYKRINAND